MDTHSRKPKRKRADSDAVINPLSHTPATLKQFARAGYPADQPLPSKIHPGFPHRAPRVAPSSSSAITDDPSDDDDENDNLTPASADIETTDPEPDTDATTAETDHKTPHRRKSRSRSRDKDYDRKSHAYHARVGWLATVIRRCLAEGDLVTAKRAFGLLVRAKVYGRRVDLRYAGFWEMGGEVLVGEGRSSSNNNNNKREGGDGDEKGEGREGEEGEEDGGGVEEVDEEREAERLERLKMYYGYLILQYPYSKQHAGSTNAVLDFQVALFSAEMEFAYGAHRRGLERLQRGEGAWGEGGEEEGDDENAMDVDEPLDYEVDGNGSGEAPERDGLNRRELRLRNKENSLRLEALRRMTDVAQRMDTVMETVPFSRDPELLRLRAMVALYLGDLSVPPAPRSRAEDKDGNKARAGQRRKARGFLRKIKEGGGELKDHDEQLLESLASDDEEDEEEDEGSVLPMFSSMGV